MKKKEKRDERFMTVNVLYRDKKPIKSKSKSKKREWKYDDFQRESKVFIGRKGNRMITDHGMKYVYNNKLSNELDKQFRNVKENKNEFVVKNKKIKVLRNEKSKTNFNKLIIKILT